jgi:hypothetical protein
MTPHELQGNYAETKLEVNKGRSWWVYSSKLVQSRFLSTVQTFWKAVSVTPLPDTQHFHFNYKNFIYNLFFTKYSTIILNDHNHVTLQSVTYVTQQDHSPIHSHFLYW